MRVAAAVLVALTLQLSVVDAKPQPKKSGTPADRWQTLAKPTVDMPPAASSGFVENGGASIYYATYGEGEPTILLHGGMGNGDHWVLQILALSTKMQVITIDSRGHGRSTRSKAKPSYDVMADDVLAVMDHLGLAKASLVGWSDGGEIALKLAINHPERVEKLFVIAANYDANGSKPRRGKTFPTFTAYSARCRTDYAKLSKTPKQFDDLVRWLLPIWRNPMGFSKEQLRSIKAPTIVADGDHDEIIKLEQIEEMATLIPNAKLHVFKDTSHFVLWQDPEALNRVLVDFLVPPPSR